MPPQTGQQFDPSASYSPAADSTFDPNASYAPADNTPPPDNGVTLNKVANGAPSEIPLTNGDTSSPTLNTAIGVGRATASGLADIGQGVAQAVQQTGQLINPTKNEGEKHWYDTTPIARVGKGLYNLGEQAVGLGKEYARDGGPTLSEAGTALRHVPGQAAGQMIAGEIGGKAIEGAADLRTQGVTPTARVANRIRAGSPPTDAAVRTLPDSAVAASDDVNRAVAPTATDFRSREQIHVSAGDLGEIANRVDWNGARGGKISPDMRPRAVLNATDAYMKQMYQTEVAPKIQAVGDSPVNIAVSTKDGLEFMSKYAGDSDVRAAANRILTDPSKATMADAYTLGRGVNAELHNFEKATPAEQNLIRNQSPQINALEELDHATSKGISDTFASKGIPGIKLFERRYAALSNFRRELQMRVSQAEAERATFNPVKAVGQALVKGKTGIASASASSLADLGPGGMGDMLERGMKSLSKSGVKPMKDTAPPAPNVQMSAPKGTTGGAPQRPFSFMENPRPDKSGPVYPGGQGTQGAQAPASAAKNPQGPAPNPGGQNIPATSSAPPSPEPEPAPTNNYEAKNFGGKAPGYVKNNYTEAPKTSGGTSALSGQKPDPKTSLAGSSPSSEIIGQRTAKPRTPGVPIELGFNHEPAPDLGHSARQATEAKQGPMPRGERRAQPRSLDEQQNQQSFSQARQQLESERPGENHSFEDVQARADELKAAAKKPPRSVPTTKPVKEAVATGTPKQFLHIVGADEKSIVKTPQDEATVQHFQNKIKAGKEITPPELHYDEKGNIVGADGRHRALAYQREGINNFKVNVKTHAFEKAAPPSAKPGMLRALSKKKLD